MNDKITIYDVHAHVSDLKAENKRLKAKEKFTSALNEKLLGNAKKNKAEIDQLKKCRDFDDKRISNFILREIELESRLPKFAEKIVKWPYDGKEMFTKIRKQKERIKELESFVDDVRNDPECCLDVRLAAVEVLK